MYSLSNSATKRVTCLSKHANEFALGKIFISSKLQQGTAPAFAIQHEVAEAGARQRGKQIRLGGVRGQARGQRVQQRPVDREQIASGPVGGAVGIAVGGEARVGVVRRHCAKMEDVHIAVRVRARVALHCLQAAALAALGLTERALAPAGRGREGHVAGMGDDRVGNGGLKGPLARLGASTRGLAREKLA